jgi:hypothetical protein
MNNKINKKIEELEKIIEEDGDMISIEMREELVLMLETNKLMKVMVK